MSEVTGSNKAEELQRLWKAMVKLFPSWSLPIDWFFSPSTYRVLGVDMISSQLHDRRVRRASALLQGAPEDVLDSLAQMARLNADRATNVFRGVAVCYITLPIALAALLSEAAPDMVTATIADNLDLIVILVGGAIITPVVYFLGMWRAKQIVWAIDLHRAGGVTPFLRKSKKRPPKHSRSATP